MVPYLCGSAYYPVVDLGRKLLSVRREWPNSFAMVTDLGDLRPIPAKDDYEALATANGTMVGAIIDHDIHGTAVAEVWLGPAPDDLPCVDTSYFYSEAGGIVLGDSRYEEQELAVIGPGTHKLRVLRDEPGSMTRVVFEFTKMPRPPMPPGRCRTTTPDNQRAERLWHGYPRHTGAPLGGPHSVSEPTS